MDDGLAPTAKLMPQKDSVMALIRHDPMAIAGLLLIGISGVLFFYVLRKTAMVGYHLPSNFFELKGDHLDCSLGLSKGEQTACMVTLARLLDLAMWDTGDYFACYRPVQIVSGPFGLHL